MWKSCQKRRGACGGVWYRRGMEIVVVNHSQWKEPKDFIEKWMQALSQELEKAKHPVSDMEVTIAFIEKLEIQRINQEFRSKDKPTDILSFEDEDPSVLGELALCGEIVDQQAKDHDLSMEEELGYLLVHGVLHLLGYEHEQGGEDEKKMFALQDQLFDSLRERFF